MREVVLEFDKNFYEEGESIKLKPETVEISDYSKDKIFQVWWEEIDEETYYHVIFEITEGKITSEELRTGY